MERLCYGWVGYRCFEKPVLDGATRFCNRHFRREQAATLSPALDEACHAVLE
jgi:hypothetical protein